MTRADQGWSKTLKVFIVTLIVIFGGLLTSVYLQLSHPEALHVVELYFDSLVMFAVTETDGTIGFVIAWAAVIVLWMLLIGALFLVLEQIYKFGRWFVQFV